MGARRKKRRFKVFLIMKYLVILQTVTSSKRLPAKALLTLGEVPLFLFCAKRIKNLELVVATSNEKNDDILERLLNKEKIECFRGDRDDVLSRFIEIIKYKELDDHDTIIRCTADNPVVDENFIIECKKFYESNNLEYLSAQPLDLKVVNWPNGLSVEFVKVKHLKNSYLQDTSKFNKEHVTSYIKKKLHPYITFDKEKKFKNNYNGLIATIDYYKDYIRIANALSRLNNPISKGYLDLLESIKNEKI